jgi:DNA recombination protein RmuC
MFSLMELIGGAIIGIAIAWLYFRSSRAVLVERLGARDRQIQESDLQLRQCQDEAAALHQEVTGLKTSGAALSATLEQERRAGAEKLLASARSAEERIALIKTAAEQQLATERQAAQGKLILLEEARQKLSDAFGALSSEALKSNNQAFLQLAKETFDKLQLQSVGDLQGRQQSIEQLVKPLAESLGKVDRQIQEMEKSRAGAYSGLSEQVKSMIETQSRLRTETANLVNALRTPQARGRWGEVQLRRVVEIAGMIERCDFDEQPSVDTPDGRLRPDLVVHLPLGKSIVVDSKVPLKAYLEAVEAPDDATRASKLAEHASQLRAHMDRLAAKSYWEQFQPAPEFVVLFLPGESIFSVALEQDPSLIESGPQQGVVLATPTTLIALLKAVSYGWHQEAIAASAQDIAALGKELYERLCKTCVHFEEIRRSLDKAVSSYNLAVGSIESRVLVTARKLKEITGSSRELAMLNGVDRTTRSLQAPPVEREPRVPLTSIVTKTN